MRMPDLWPMRGIIERVRDEENWESITINGYGFDSISLEEVSEIINSNQKQEENNMTQVSPMAEKFVDADTKALMEAGYLSSSLEITSAGTIVRDAALFDLVKADMVKSAKAKNKEEAKK